MSSAVIILVVLVALCVWGWVDAGRSLPNENTDNSEEN